MYNNVTSFLIEEIPEYITTFETVQDGDKKIIKSKRKKKLIQEDNIVIEETISEDEIGKPEDQQSGVIIEEILKGNIVSTLNIFYILK